MRKDAWGGVMAAACQHAGRPRVEGTSACESVVIGSFGGEEPREGRCF